MGLATSAISQGRRSPQLHPSRAAAGRRTTRKGTGQAKAAPSAGERSPARVHSLLTNSASQAPCCACMPAQPLSRVQLSATPWTVVHQAPLSLGFPRQEYWSELSFPSPGALPNPRIEPTSPALAGRFFTTEPPGKTLCMVCICLYLYSNTF